MRIAGIFLILIACAWLIVTQFAAALPKAGNYSRRLANLPVQETYSREQVRDIVWDISALRWSFPEQDKYSRQEVTNILLVATMNHKAARDGTAPSVMAPAVFALVGTFMLGLGIGKSRNVKRAT